VNLSFCVIRNLSFENTLFKSPGQSLDARPIIDLQAPYPLIFNMTRMAVIDCESTRATLSPRMIRGIKFLFADSVSVTAVRALG
jgi:hypothetical protein